MFNRFIKLKSQKEIESKEIQEKKHHESKLKNK